MKKLSLSQKTLLGMFIGIFLGLFLGEEAAGFYLVGKIYIMCMLINVIPYMICSLVVGIGSLTRVQAKFLALRGIYILGGGWVVGYIMILIFAHSFPQMSSASFFSSPVAVSSTSNSPLDAYIPENPFNALASGIVPAIVVFSILFGIAVMSLKKNKPFLATLTVASKVVSTASSKIISTLTPYGILAITAEGVGTTSGADFERLSVYFICYLCAALIFTFLVIPSFVRLFTPISYKEFFHEMSAPLLLGFASGSVFIALIPAIEGCKRLIRKQTDDEDTANFAGMITTLLYNFPVVASILSLLFIFFAAWYYGSPLGIIDGITVLITGTLSLFGSGTRTIISLLNTNHIPSDAFNLYMPSTLVTRRFAALLRISELAGYGLCCAGVMAGLCKFKVRRLLVSVSIFLIVTCGFSLALGMLFHEIISPNYAALDLLEGMTVENRVKETVLYAVPAGVSNTEGQQSNEDLFHTIQKRKVLRIGYDPASLPFAYFNKKKELVGLDVAMAQLLAKDLDCSIVWVPFSYSNVVSILKEGTVDILMSSVSITDERLQSLHFAPLQNLDLSFMCKDERRDFFEDLESIQEAKDLTLCIVTGSSYKQVIEHLLPHAKIIELKKREDYFDGTIKADAMFMSAESGKAWALRYPAFTAVVPWPSIGVNLVGYPIVAGNPLFIQFLKGWVEYQKKTGRLEKENKKWVLGEDPLKKKKQWSIMKNVLHW